MSEELMGLPRAQFHLFEARDVSPNVCRRCGQLPQAHPTPELLAKIESKGGTGHWVENDDDEVVAASWSNVWWLFKRALGCAVRGHRYGIDWQDIPAYGPPTTRYCDRCNRDWVWLSCEH